LRDIEFGEPQLRRVRRVIKYELDGVAFVKGYEKTIGFTFECSYSGKNWRLKMEDLYQAKELYQFFNKLLENCLESNSGLSKFYSTLHAEWVISEGKIQEALNRIERVMGVAWKDAFKTLISVWER